MRRPKKTCQSPGCQAKARYNTPSPENMKTKNAIYCKEHAKELCKKGAEKMVDLCQRRCEHKDCPIQPSFNIPGSSIGRFCKKHKEEGMVCTVREFCTHKLSPEEQETTTTPVGRSAYATCNPLVVARKSLTCKNFASYNFNTAVPRRPLFCSNHKQEGMVNVINLTKEAAEKKKIKSTFKINKRKKEEQETDLEVEQPKKTKPRLYRGSKLTCQQVFSDCDYACSNQAIFDYSTNTLPRCFPKFCLQHAQGKDNMIDVVSESCIVSGCRKYPTYGYVNQKMRVYCEDHAQHAAVSSKLVIC